MFVLVRGVNRLRQVSLFFTPSLSIYRLFVRVEALVKSGDLLPQRFIVGPHGGFAYVRRAFVQRRVEPLEDLTILAQVLRVHVQAVLVVVVAFLLHLALQGLPVRLFLVLFSLPLQSEIHRVFGLPLRRQAFRFGEAAV